MTSIDQKVKELRGRLEAVKQQRDKARRGRSALQWKLAAANRGLELIRGDHLARWGEDAVRSFDLSLPDASLVEHIAFRKDSAPTEPDLGFLHRGYLIMLELRELLATHCPEALGEARSILDFGCGCARVSRFLKSLIPGGELEVWGADIDAEAIEWNKRTLQGSGSYFRSPDTPPFESGLRQFDLILALSVFTHLPLAMQDPWITELKAKLNPGGVLVATFHGEAHHRHLDDEARSRLDENGIVHVDLGKTPGLPDYYLSTFHATDYVKRHWGKHFANLKVEQPGLNGQAVAVMSDARMSS